MTTAMDLNLDSMTHDELVQFASEFIGHGVRPISAARELFPDRTRGIVRATIDLRNYAWNKATAIQCRLDGKVGAALMHEGICDRIYSHMPEWAKGW